MTAGPIAPGPMTAASDRFGRPALRRALAAVATGVAAAVALATSALPARAAEIRVLTAGAFKPIVTSLAPVFEQRTGHTLVVDNDTAGALEKRILAGETFDLVVLPPAGLDRLVKQGAVADAPARLARVAIGVAVKEGAAPPDISTPESFRQALLDARRVAFIDPAAGGSSGIYLSQLFAKWGIAAQIDAKAVLVPGGLVAQRLVTGEADLALHQISEILAVPGVTLVGPLPAAIQNYTVYAGGIAARSPDPTAARALLVFLGGPDAAAVLRERGMEPP